MLENHRVFPELPSSIDHRRAEDLRIDREWAQAGAGQQPKRCLECDEKPCVCLVDGQIGDLA
jgi:hypothetical protein